MRKSVYGVFSVLILSSFVPQLLARQPFYDRSHYSEVFREEREYRLFLPPGYEDQTERHYPVIYYFHGHSDRYTLEHYDDGKITVPAVVDFVSKNNVIVVAVDGYVAEHYTGFYGGNPWDIREDGGHYDFGRYFLELIEHIDSTYRTLTDRRHRATSGLSMGGFMSLYLSARFPDLVGSASSFNPGPMFYIGNPGRTILWWPPHHTDNHTHSRIRLVRASGDYISQYHEEAREIYARALEVDFEYRQDEFHRHAATSIEETFAFHVESFADPTLNNVPVEWSHHNPFAEFDVWDYQFRAPGEEKALIYLEKVSQGGLRVRTRQWAPDGPPLASRMVEVATAPLYRPDEQYRLIGYDLSKDKTSHRTVASDSSGRLIFEIDGSGHQIGIVGPGTGAQPPVLLPVTEKDHLYLPPNKLLSLPLRVFNPRGEVMENVRVQVSSEYPTVEILSGSHEIAALGSGEVADLSPHLSLRLTAGGGYYDFASLLVRMTYDGWYSRQERIDFRIIPEIVSEPVAVEIMDGRTKTFTVFHQTGNQGGGGPIEREVSEGKGNGNGILEPGEEATIWVQMRQGIDPFDKNNWYRCKVRTDSPWISEVADIQENKQREWTGAKERTSLIRLSPETPSGTSIPLILDNETWSFYYTPDVRYGTERLYQAFQRHQHHLHRLEITVE